jgi:hypothetical protein
MYAVIRRYQFDPKSSEEINRPISGRLRPWPPLKGTFSWPTWVMELPAEASGEAPPPEFGSIQHKD